MMIDIREERGGGGVCRSSQRGCGVRQTQKKRKKKKKMSYYRGVSLLF